MNATIVISKKIKSRIAKRLVTRAQKNTQFLHINLWKERWRQQDKDTPHFQNQRFANCKNDSLHSFRSVHDAKTGDGTNTCNIIHVDIHAAFHRIQKSLSLWLLWRTNYVLYLYLYVCTILLFPLNFLQNSYVLKECLKYEIIAGPTFWVDLHMALGCVWLGFEKWPLGLLAFKKSKSPQKCVWLLYV